MNTYIMQFFFDGNYGKFSYCLKDLRQRIAENKKKKEEKQLKNEVYQVVRNPNKIKKMKKSDLVKRDILAKVQ